MARAPVFLRDDVERLSDFLKKYVKYGDTSRILYKIDHGRLRPSKNLADHLSSLLQGNREFEMIDDQKVVYETAAGVEFAWRRTDGTVRRRFKSEAEGLAQAVARSRPRVCFFGHHHTRLDAEIAGVRCVGLNKVAMPGNLVAIDISAREHGYEILAEWPRREQLSS